MFVHYEKKLIRERIGYVADFCPICCDVCTSAIVEIRRVHKVYFFSLGHGKFIGEERECLGCRCVFEANRNRYGHLAKSADEDWELLLRTANVETRRDIERRTDLEQRLESRRFSSQERRALLIEPIAALEYQVHRRRKSGDAVCSRSPPSFR